MSFRTCLPKIRLRAFDAYRLIMPYTSIRMMEQVKAVVPLAIYLVLFQVLILRQNVSDSGIITVGLVDATRRNPWQQPAG
jgi:hypothetical protein